MVRIAKVIMVVLILCLAVSLFQPAKAEQTSVLDGLFQIHIGERILTVPLYYSLTVYEKRKDLTPKVMDLFERMKSWIGQVISYWFCQQGTCAELPAGPNSDLILESNLYFQGIDEWKEIGMTPDGGKTVYHAQLIENKGQTVYVDLSKMPPGARGLSWCVRHNKDEKYVVIGFIKITNRVEGRSDGGIFIGLQEAPEFFSQLSPEAKFSYISGMRYAIAQTSNPELVTKELEQIKLKQLAATKAVIQVTGTPNAEIEFGYIGGGEPVKAKLNAQGQLQLNNIEPGKALKVMYIGAPNWKEITCSSGQIATVDLGTVPTTSVSAVKVKTNEFKFINNSQMDANLIFEFRNPNGKIETLTRNVKSYSFIRWDVSSDYQVRIKKQTGEISNWIAMGQNHEVLFLSIKFSKEVAVQ